MERVGNALEQLLPASIRAKSRLHDAMAAMTKPAVASAVRLKHCVPSVRFPASFDAQSMRTQAQSGVLASLWAALLMCVVACFALSLVEQVALGRALQLEKRRGRASVAKR